MNYKVIIIANPVSGGASKKKLKIASETVKANGFEPELLFTRGPGDAESLAGEAADNGAYRVIAAGGDGTFNEVANGLVSKEVPMAILPLGTTNVLAAELGIPGSTEKAVDVALSKEPRNVSLGKITIENRSRCFCLMAGFGFDAATVNRVSRRGIRLSGKLAYVASGLGVLARWAPEKLTVTADGSTHYCHCLIATNVSKYAGNYLLAPDANIAKPDMDVILIQGSGRFDILRFAIGLITNRVDSMKEVEHLKCRNLIVEGEAHVQIDGDYFGKSPASITVSPDALQLIY